MENPVGCSKIPIVVKDFPEEYIRTCGFPLVENLVFLADLKII